MRLLPLILPSLLALAACAHAPETAPSEPGLDVDAVARLLPAKVKAGDRPGWAEDIVSAIRLVHKEPTAERVCAVVAVIEQESNFQSDPPVPDLPGIVRRGLDDKLAPLGPLAGAAKDAILDAYGDRIAKLRTEHDLDRLFRDIAAEYSSKLPGPVSAIFGGVVADLNPVTTAGSMQVKVSFAHSLEKDLADEDVRELLYTRSGGVRFGTARLIGYVAEYDDILFRFADYNGGMYSARNAAFQAALADVAHTELALDGDLLAYDRGGDVKDVETNTLKALLAFGAAHNLSSWRVHRDAKLEKSHDFEDTDTWKAVRAAYRDRHDGDPPYARMPDVALVSPKLAHPRTTSWFAASVKKHYDACRAR